MRIACDLAPEPFGLSNSLMLPLELDLCQHDAGEVAFINLGVHQRLIRPEHVPDKAQPKRVSSRSEPEHVPLA